MNFLKKFWNSANGKKTASGLLIYVIGLAMHNNGIEGATTVIDTGLALTGFGALHKIFKPGGN